MKYLVAITAFAALLGSAVYSFSLTASEEQWPDLKLPYTAEQAVRKAQKAWRASPSDWKNQLVEHSPTGDYTNYGAGICAESAILKDDGTGVFKIRVQGGKEYHYHAVLLAQCGLKAYGRWLRTSDGQYLETAILHGRKLIDIQDEVGAFRYPFPWRYYVTNQTIPAGWTSAMAQGQAMSLFVRLYDATKDEAFINAGGKALAYMLTPTTSGGVMTTLADFNPSLKDYVFFEEIVTQPNDNYILNGYMFALLGLYDWSQVPAQIKADQLMAKDYFNRGIVTLERILPYYDMGGMTAYDLTHFTFNNNKNLFVNAPYHAVHVYLLHALYTVTGSEFLRDKRDLWASYLDDALAASE